MVAERSFRPCPRSPSGFSLIEVLVASLIFCVAFTELARLVPLATRSTRQAREQAYALLLATQKLEELRDAADAGGLALSAADAWSRSVDGFLEYLGEDGASLGADVGLMPPDGALYVRRWAVTALPADPMNGRVLRAFVAPIGRDGGAGARAGAGAGAALVHVRTAP